MALFPNRHISIVIISLLVFLNGCATNMNVTPYRIPEISYLEIDQNAYLWTSGIRRGLFNLFDYAIITALDDLKIPKVHLPLPGSDLTPNNLLEIPPGRHTVEILYREGTLICSWAGCLAFNKSRRTLTFIAESNRTYAPFVSDSCSRTWYWIEDWGSYEEGSVTSNFIIENESDLTNPVVAGEAPAGSACK